jgi:hypothetical protein
MADKTFLNRPLSLKSEANMGWKILVATCLLWSSAMAAWAQGNTSSQQPFLERHDPATSGAGPTSGAPGQLDYGSPKDGSTTTDARGVTTTAPRSDAPKTDDVPPDPGNESVGATPRM